MRRLLLLLASALALAVLPTGGALALPAAHAAQDDFTLTALALLGSDGTDVYLTVSSAAGSVPDRLDKVQLTALPFEGDHLRTSNYFGLPAPGGVAVLHVAGLTRHRPLQLIAHVKEGDQNTIEAETRVLLRPDLTVAHVSVPADVVRRHQFAVTSTIAEIAGDIGASATAALFDGATRLVSKDVSVDAGAGTTVSFETVLGQAGRHDLRIAISGSSPAEANLANDEAVAPVDVHRYTSDGVVSTDHWVATKVGEDILAAGGNAIDAAAGVQFALNVVDPNLAGIGGGSAVLVRLADGRKYAIDGREVAPHATTADMYKGKTAVNVGINGYSVGVPATLRTVDEMLTRWGTMSLADVLREPIKLADEGAPVGAFLASGSAEARTLDLQPETIAMFRPGGTPLHVGDTIVQHDLAKTLSLIAEHGADVFYRGEIAQAIVDAQQRLSPTKPITGGEGRMTLDDLANLRVTVEKPLSLDYKGDEVLAPPPSTNGGLVLLETLGVYQKVQSANPHADFSWGTFAALHSQLEALRLAFADRDNVVLNVVDYGMTLQQAVDAPRMWGMVPNVNPPNANFARNPGFPQETIDTMRAIGDQIARMTTNGFGSTSSAGVDPTTLDLIGVSDKRQVSDPFASVIPRS